MAKFQSDSIGSIYNYLPKGCQICREGADLVLFITGQCERSCIYCPISKERKGEDVVFADEQAIDNIDDILKEAKAIDALGTGITGGEPLLKLDFVLDCIRALKEEFGRAHHIHLYTGILPSRGILKELRDAGLDEIRFHPSYSKWSDPVSLKKALRKAKSLGMEAGVEIPAFASAPEILEAIKSADAFLNINELELSETNFEALRPLGFESNEVGCGAKGSEEIARKHFLVEDAKVHYCPSRFKDAVQLRERLKRRAKRIARPFDCLTQEGTIIHGTITGNLTEALQVLDDLCIPKEMYFKQEDRIDIAAPILEEISKELKSINCIISVIERFPLEDGLVVERIHL